jgi:hypothetical protein
MARMLGTFGRPRCPNCRAASGPDCADASRGKSGQRQYEERQWRREVEQDVLDVEEELQFLDFVEKTWLPDWYVEKIDLIWVRL